MSMIWKLLSNPQVLAVVKLLWAFLQTEFATAISKYVAQAVPIVQAAESQLNPDGTAMSGAQKFAWAGSQLKDQLVVAGKYEAQHVIDTAIQLAVTQSQPLSK